MGRWSWLLALAAAGAPQVGWASSSCTGPQSSRCAALGGTAVGSPCVCVITSWVSRNVSNAKKGDVALVPLSVMSSPDDEAIRLTMSALAQNFSHSLIYRGQGFVTHATAIGAVGREGFHLEPADLMNATPGAVNTTIDWAFEHDRFGEEGLVAKPASEFLRPLMEAASDEAVLEVGAAYYKIGDFTENDGLMFGFAADRSVNRRGTQCAGFVWNAFSRAGIPISRHFYPADLRTEVAEVLWAGIADLAPWPFKGEIANQVVNCFAGFNKVNGVRNCDDTTGTWWISGVGSGTTVSPDNLLPVSFMLTASGPYTDTGLPGYEWTERVGYRTNVTSQKLPGDVVDSSRRCDVHGVCTSFGAPTTVLQVVELQNLTGGYWDTTVLTSF